MAPRLEDRRTAWFLIAVLGQYGTCLPLEIVVLVDSAFVVNGVVYVNRGISRHEFGLTR